MYGTLNSLLARLLIGSAVPLVLFVAIGVLAGMAIGSLQEALEDEHASHRLVVQVNQLQNRFNELRLVERSQMLSWGSPDRKLRQDYRDARAALLEQLAQLQAGSSGDATLASRLDSIRKLEEEWRLVRERALIDLAPRPGQTREEFDRLMDGFLQQSGPLGSAMHQEMEALIDQEDARLLARQEATAEQTRRSLTMIAFALPLGLVLALYISWRAARGVTRPLSRLRQATKELIAGRFQMLAPQGPTEIEELIVHFNHMGVTLTQTARSLQEQKEDYQRYLGATTQILWTTDAAGVVADDLPTWRAFTGQSHDELHGEGWLGAVHGDDLPRFRQTWQEAVTARRTFEIHCRLRSAHGDYRHFACRGVPIVRENGTVKSWIGTCTDITEKIQEAELQRAKEAAEAANRAKSELLAKVSHELRTPLNAVIGMSKLLDTGRFGALTAKQTEYVRDITSAGEHLLGLINDLLDLAKMEAGRLELRAEEFSPSELIATLISTLRPLADDQDVQLVAAPFPDGPLHTDPARCRQVLYNLVFNAIKFTPRRGRVSVEGEWLAAAQQSAAIAPVEEAEALLIRVRDTGVGIAPEHQALIWEEFCQVQPPSPDRPQGTGLGLALTRRLVELLGGVIWLESEPGQGSTFSFVLPRHLPAAPAPEGTAPGCTAHICAAPGCTECGTPERAESGGSESSVGGATK